MNPARVAALLRELADELDAEASAPNAPKRRRRAPIVAAPSTPPADELAIADARRALRRLGRLA